MLQDHISDSFPELSTKRLLLNGMRAADIPTIIHLANDEEVVRHTMGMPFPYEEADAIKLLYRAITGLEEEKAYLLAIRWKSSREFLGAIGLHLIPEQQKAEVGYWIGKEYWGQGISSEALGCMLAFGFKVLKLNKILATHTTTNMASAAVMKKNGMIFEGESIADSKRNGVWRDVHHYRLLRSEFDGLHE